MKAAYAYLLRAARDAEAYFDQQVKGTGTCKLYAPIPIGRALPDAILEVDRALARERDAQNAVQFEARR